MDFVSLHYQFSSIEFYEPNTMQQEAHIKMPACMLFYIKCDCPAASVSLTVDTGCSCARTCFPTWICFSCHFLWLLTITRRSVSGDGTLLLAVNQTSINASQIVPLQCYRPPFVARFLSQKKPERGGEEAGDDITLNWIFSIGRIHLLYCLQE